MEQDDTPDLMRGPEIAEMIARSAASGDAVAFALVYEVCRPRMRSMLQLRAPDVPESVIAEVTNEAFACLLEPDNGFNPACHEPIGWLFALARNSLMRAVRGHVERMRVVDRMQLERPFPRPLEDRLHTRERMRRLLTAFAALPQLERDLLIDLFWHRRSHSSIAKLRGMPPGTVKSKLARVVVRLRAVTQEDGE